MPNGEEVARYTARFKRWTGEPVEDTWNGKPTIDFHGAPQWGEFAVLLSLADGWEGYDVECYGRPIRFWRTSLFHPPDRNYGLTPPEHIRLFLDTIARENRKNGSGKPCYAGCWDLIAWRGTDYRIIEVKWHRHDSVRHTQNEWFEAGKRAGVPLECFMIVEWVFEPLPHPIRQPAPAVPCTKLRPLKMRNVVSTETAAESGSKAEIFASRSNNFDELYCQFLDYISAHHSREDVIVQRTPACVRTFYAINGYDLILEGIDNRRLRFVIKKEQIRRLYDSFDSVEQMLEYEQGRSPNGKHGVYRLNDFVKKNATECEPLFIMLKEFEKNLNRRK